MNKAIQKANERWLNREGPPKKTPAQINAIKAAIRKFDDYKNRKFKYERRDESLCL